MTYVVNSPKAAGGRKISRNTGLFGIPASLDIGSLHFFPQQFFFSLSVSESKQDTLERKLAHLKKINIEAVELLHSTPKIKKKE